MRALFTTLFNNFFVVVIAYTTLFAVDKVICTGGRRRTRWCCRRWGRGTGVNRHGGAATVIRSLLMLVNEERTSWSDKSEHGWDIIVFTPHLKDLFLESALSALGGAVPYGMSKPHSPPPLGALGRIMTARKNRIHANM